MRSAFALLAAAALALSLAGGAQAQKIDKNGRCHDASGKFAKAEVCQGGAVAAATPSKSTTPSKSVAPAAAAPPARASATAPQKCRDKTTKKFAKCGGANAEPVPG
jgi:hypothetical protein